MRLVVSLLVVAGCGVATDVAEAQIFGPRRLGGPISRREQVGELTGSERFLRENRGRRDFVGRDIREIDAFVGAQQAIVAGGVRPAAEDLRPVEQTDVNRPSNTQRRRSELYPPKLTLGFTLNTVPPAEVGSTLQGRLERLPMNQAETIRVTMTGRTAILEGVVATDHDRVLAEQLALLEPGIDRVENRLNVETLPAPEPGTP